MVAKDLRDILVYSLIAILLALVVDYVFYLTGNLQNQTSILAWGFLRMYTPTIAVVVLGGPSILKKYLRINGRAAITYLAAPLVTFAALSIYLAILIATGNFTLRQITSLLAVSSIDFPAFMATTFFNAYIVSLTLNAIFALGEEIGWRGYLLDKFKLNGMGLVKASIIVGAIWGIWHASAIILLGHNYPENRLVGVPLFTIYTISATLPHVLVRKISSSVLPAASLHGSINAVWGLTILTTDLPREIAGLGPISYASWTAISIILYSVLLMGKAHGMHRQGHDQSVDLSAHP